MSTFLFWATFHANEYNIGPILGQDTVNIGFLLRHHHTHCTKYSIYKCTLEQPEENCTLCKCHNIMAMAINALNKMLLEIFYNRLVTILKLKIIADAYLWKSFCKMMEFQTKTDRNFLLISTFTESEYIF